MLRLLAFFSKWTLVIAIKLGSYPLGRKLEDYSLGNLTSPKGRLKPMISIYPPKQASTMTLY